MRYLTRFFCFLANKFFERKKEIFGVFGVAVDFSSVFSVCVPKFLCLGQGNLLKGIDNKTARRQGLESIIRVFVYSQ